MQNWGSLNLNVRPVSPSFVGRGVSQVWRFQYQIITAQSGTSRVLPKMCTEKIGMGRKPGFQGEEPWTERAGVSGEIREDPSWVKAPFGDPGTEKVGVMDAGVPSLGVPELGSPGLEGKRERLSQV